MTKETHEEALASELKTLQETHKRVRSFIVPIDEDDDTKTVTFFLKPIDNKTKTMINKLANKDTTSAVIAGLKALRLGGNEVDSIKENDYAISSAEAGLVKYMAPGEVVIKKN